MTTATSPPSPHSVLPPRVPLVIGVTGHRDLRTEDIAALEALVDAILSELRTQFPNSPLVFLSPLAEGADCLAARIALKAGARLIVPLPLGLAEYEETFTTPQARAEFRQLLQRAERCLILPRIDVAESELPDGRTWRGLQYALVGAFVARHCQVLIALWNGQPSAQPAGTPQIVAFKRTGRFKDEAVEALLRRVPEPFGLSPAPLTLPQPGPVYHIVTPRVRDPQPPHALTWQVLPPVGQEEPDQCAEAEARTALVRQRIRLFNADAAQAGSFTELEAAALLPANQLVGLPGELGALATMYATASALALTFQARAFALQRGLFVLAFLATCALGIHADLVVDPRENSLFLSLYLLLAGLAGLGYLWGRVTDSANKHQDYRALAEGLRVQFFWRLAGLELMASHYYLRMQKSDLEWIRHGLRAWGLWVPPIRPGRLELVACHWVANQRAYYQNAARRDRARLVRLREVGNGFLLFGLGLAVLGVLRQHPLAAAAGVFAVLATVVPRLALDFVKESRRDRWTGLFRRVGHLATGVAGGLALLLLIGTLPHLLPEALWSGALGLRPDIYGRRSGPTAFLPDAHEPMMLTAALSAVVAALAHGYADKRGYKEHAKWYDRMGVLFASAEPRLAELLDRGREDEAQQLVIDLGEEALAESSRWLLLHRERQLEVPRP